jgi:hypothetical protein
VSRFRAIAEEHPPTSGLVIMSPEIILVPGHPAHCQCQECADALEVEAKKILADQRKRAIELLGA